MVTLVRDLPHSLSGTMRRPSPCWLYGRLYRARNSFLHGNPVSLVGADGFFEIGPANRLGGMSEMGRCCSLIPDVDVKLSTRRLAGLTVLSAVGARPPHDGVR